MVNKKYKRLTPEEWRKARLKYESDKRVSFAEIAAKFGVSKAAVGKMALKQKWSKVGALESIARAAHLRADEAEVDGNVDSQKPLPDSFERSTDLRTKLIQSHRAEWRKHANLFPLEEIKNSLTIGRSGKVSAEMIALRQKAERIAWGMDDVSQDNKTFVIERSYA